MIISAALFEDLVDVLALEREAAEAPHWPDAVYRAIVDSETGSGSVRRCLLLARKDEVLVGFAVGKIVAAEAELESVVVQETARRCGVGRALCEGVLEWALANGARTVELEVRAASAGAIALYTGLRFMAVGWRREYYTEPVEDALLMRLG